MDSLLDREIDDILNSTDSEYAVVVNDDLVGAILGDDDNGIASSSFTMEVSPIPQCSNIDTEVVTTEISEQSKDEITSNFDIRDVLNKEEKNGVGEKPVLPNIAAETVDTEHLDYEEDNESKPQRSSKFRSERNTSERQQDSDFTAKNSSIKKLGFSDHVSSFDKERRFPFQGQRFNARSAHINPNFRERNRAFAPRFFPCPDPHMAMSHPFPFVRPPPTQIPTMVPPGFIMAAQAPFGMSVGVAMPHSQFQPGCIVQNQMPVSSVHGNRFPFPSRYPYQPQTVRFPTQIPPKNISSSDGANWELMVDAFVRKTTSGEQRRSSSRSSYSSSYTSSRSRSSYSSGSQRNHRKTGNSPSASRIRPKNRPRFREQGRRYRGRNQRQFSISPDRNAEKEKERTIECAKAIGLDEAYLKKIDEQKQLREQIQKRKLQSREQRNRPPKTTGADQKRPSSSSSAKPEQEKEGKMPKSLDDLKQKRPRIESQKSSSTDAKEQDLGKSNKLKPYLAVVVTNVKDLQNAYKRLSRDITSLGPTKKIWQSSPDSVCAIFEKHEDAKQFMLQFHGKSINNVRLDVTMEKVFLNLAAMP